MQRFGFGCDLIDQKYLRFNKFIFRKALNSTPLFS